MRKARSENVQVQVEIDRQPYQRVSPERTTLMTTSRIPLDYGATHSHRCTCRTYAIPRFRKEKFVRRLEARLRSESRRGADVWDSAENEWSYTQERVYDFGRFFINDAVTVATFICGSCLENEREAFQEEWVRAHPEEVAKQRLAEAKKSLQEQINRTGTQGQSYRSKRNLG
jgi:hypothetical protein